jgi:acyl carrier protein
VDRETLRKELRVLVASLLEIEHFGDQDYFARDLGADSMLLEQLAFDIEDRYHITFPEEQLREILCLDDAVRVVGGLLRLPQ